MIFDYAISKKTNHFHPLILEWLCYFDNSIGLCHFLPFMFLTLILSPFAVSNSQIPIHLLHNSLKYLRRTFYLRAKQTFVESFVIYLLKYLFTGIRKLSKRWILIWTFYRLTLKSFSKYLNCYKVYLINIIIFSCNAYYLKNF